MPGQINAETTSDEAAKAATTEATNAAPYCSACGQLITSTLRRISRKGNHEHTVFNPAGQVFQIACYSEAPSAAPAGDAADKYTWFPDLSWHVTFCRDCGRYMGWQF